MQHHSLIVRAVVVLACFVGIAACSDDDTAASGSSNSCTGTRLTDDQLCKLTCKTSTPNDATVALGAPSTSTSGSDTQINQYTYSCVENGQANLLSYSTYFTNGVLTDVRVTAAGTFASTALPACISSCKP